MAWQAAPDRDSLRFFRPITQRIWMVGASLLTINFVAPRAYSMPARGLNHHKTPLKRTKQRSRSCQCRQSIQRTGRPTRSYLQHMGVNHRGRHIRVPEQFLHGADICTCAAACAGCAGPGQRLPGAAMHDLRWWMAGDVLQNSGAGGAVRVACE
jgi:hypothetical protein